MAYTPPPLPYHGPVAHSSGTGNLPINRLVIHCTAGSDAKGAQGTARYFRDPASKGSAHYITDSDEAIQCARDNVVCWHAPPNTHSLGIEMECSLAGQGNGHWGRADHIAMMKITAKLTAQKAIQYNVPITKLTPADLKAGKRGICGHHDVSLAFGQSSHWDPGPYFPWAQFMTWVREAAAAITGGSTPNPPTEDDMAGEGPAILAGVKRLEALFAKGGSEANRYSALQDAINATKALVEELKGAVLPGMQASLSDHDRQEDARYGEYVGRFNAINNQLDDIMRAVGTTPPEPPAPTLPKV